MCLRNLANITAKNNGNPTAIQLDTPPPHLLQVLFCNYQRDKCTITFLHSCASVETIISLLSSQFTPTFREKNIVSLKNTEAQKATENTYGALL